MHTEDRRPSPRRSTRFRPNQPPHTPFSVAPPREPSNEQQDLASTGRQRRPRSSDDEAPYHAENARPRKRPRLNPHSGSDCSLPLNEHNLERHNTLLMDISGGRGYKRSMSRTRSESASTATSQKSRSTAAHYRFGPLSKARIRIHHRPTPEIRTQIDTVIQHKVISERKEKLSLIAQQLSDSFVEVVSHAVGEDDCIEPFYDVLSFMDHSASFTFPRKAGMVSPLYPYPSSCSLHV